MFLWWCQTMGSQKAGPVRLELETNEVERVCVCALLCFCTLRRLVLTHPVLGPMMIGKPCVGSWAYRRRNPTCQEPTGVPKHLRICAKKMAIREYHQQLLLLILKIVSQQAWQHHGGEKTMVGPATPRKILAFTISMNFYIATISGARSFAIWRSCTCQIKKRNAHDQADAFYALNSILRPLHFVFSRMYLPGSNAQSPHGTWKICHNVTERLIFKKISVPSDKNLGFFPHKENAAHASLDKRCTSSAFASRSWPGRGPQENSTNTFHA